MRLAILIAARDEEARLGACLASLRPFRATGDAVVVADDGSSDATAAIALREGATSLLPLDGAGRAQAYRRCFEGAPADADALLVAQADMRFPEGARAAIESILYPASGAGRSWGCFRQRIDEAGAGLGLVEFGNLLRAKWLGLPYGDQAVFFRRDALERAGGFPDQERMEDLELALRLRAAFGRPAIAPGAARVAISKRHWRRGALRQTFANWRAALDYSLARRRTAIDDPERGEEKG